MLFNKSFCHKSSYLSVRFLYRLLYAGDFCYRLWLYDRRLRGSHIRHSRGFARTGEAHQCLRTVAPLPRHRIANWTTDGRYSLRSNAFVFARFRFGWCYNCYKWFYTVRHTADAATFGATCATTTAAAAAECGEWTNEVLMQWSGRQCVAKCVSDD